MEYLFENAGLLAGVSLWLGLLVGSFLNVVIYRLPKTLDRKWKIECRDYLELEPDPQLLKEKLSIAWPGSQCPKCKSNIRPWHNIPVIGFLLLKGKCADCGTSIGLRYPIVELLTGILSVLVVWKFGATYESLLALGFTWCLIALAGIDLDTKLLPDNITLPLLWAGLIVNFFDTFTTFSSAFWGAVAGYMILWVVFWGFKLLTGKEGMGYGDFKLLAALGAWLGWPALPMIILISSVVGLAVAVLMMVFMSHDRRVPIAFGPYLAIAGWIAFLFGEQVQQMFPIFSIV